jgi:beta-galactosidase
MSTLSSGLGGRLAFGGDYNPEQWSPEVWPEDIELMRRAGVNLVSLGIFSWAWLQPKPGVFEFGWMDRILDLLHAGGVKVDLANASASPPPWFSHQYPDSLPVDIDGVRRSYGARQAFCPSSATYRAASAELTAAIAQRYADHPAVVMWHVHNEYGCHNAQCYCDNSAEAFRTWLQRRYGELDELNAAWGTAFWSQRYYDWAEILPPRRTAYHTFANPTQQLDFARFSSDELLDCFRAEAEIIRRHSDLPVTTNYMGFFEPLDYWRWSAEMDLISNDHYRHQYLGEPAATHDLVMSGDLMRSLSDGAPWLLMEHSTSAVNWQPRNAAKLAGQTRRDSLTHVARGADGALYFQWRASAAGAEKYHSAMLPHAGTDSRRWGEVVQLGADLQALTPILGSRVHADVAIVLEWSAGWGSSLDSHPTVDLKQIEQIRSWHRALWEAGITCDFVHPDRDLDGYRVILVPSLYACGDNVGPRLSAAVAGGVHVVIGPFSGVVDLDDHIGLGGYPGAFRDLLGIRSEEFSPLQDAQVIPLEGEIDDTGSASATIWTELIRPQGAQVLARFGGGVFPGEPAITVHQGAEGAGRAWYIGTVPDPGTLATILRQACEHAGVGPALEDAAGLDITVRSVADATFVCAVNHGDRAIALPVAGVDLLTGRTWSSGDALAGGGVAVVRRAD